MMQRFAYVWYDIMRSSELRLVCSEAGPRSGPVDLQAKMQGKWTVLFFDPSGLSPQPDPEPPNKAWWLW